MNALSEIQIECWMPDPPVVAEEIKMLGAVLHACVESGASVSFVLPFSRDDASAFWNSKVLPAVRAGGVPDGRGP